MWEACWLGLVTFLEGFLINEGWEEGESWGHAVSHSAWARGALCLSGAFSTASTSVPAVEPLRATSLLQGWAVEPLAEAVGVVAADVTKGECRFRSQV